ncbi:MAG: NAD(P)-dependent alcohol dehydrogenase [Gammaproteobacteria bacterium]|nr:NAD(P)-dependent alcohol dehydrogenase [Gammaproteobacteria bacterium]
MKAVIHTRYGPPDILKLGEIELPVAKDDEVLVRVHAATVNRTDCANHRAKPFFMRFVTGLLRPKKNVPGTEFAGVIEAVGNRISSLEPGEKVFGFDDEVSGSQAQYLAITDEKVARMPEGVTFGQAAASSEGFHYAYNFINKVRIEQGQDVLVNGATGAIGSAMVQLLEYYQVNVTAVCAAKNIELVKSLGANRVIDFENEDFTKDDKRYDYVFDTVGKSSFFKCMKLLKPGGIYISSDLGYMAQNLFLPLITPLIKPFFKAKKTVFPVPVDIKASLSLVRELIEQGRFKAVIDRSFLLEEIVEAYNYVETGEKTGNVVITVDN